MVAEKKKPLVDEDRPCVEIGGADLVAVCSTARSATALGTFTVGRGFVIRGQWGAYKIRWENYLSNGLPS